MSDEISWECTLSIGPARTILELINTAYNKGMLPKDADPIMRAIAYQHPALVEEFSWLPWPFN